MSNMKEAMKSQTNTEFEAAMIKQKMEKLFLQDREGENRYSAIEHSFSAYFSDKTRENSFLSNH